MVRFSTGQEVDAPDPCVVHGSTVVHLSLTATLRGKDFFLLLV